MTKPIIVVTICYKLLYVIQVVKKIFDKYNFLASTDIKVFGRTVTPKSVPPKIGPAGPILAEKPAKTGLPGPLLLPKSVPPCQNQSPGGPILAKNYLPKSVPHKVALLFMRVHGCMDIAIITGYLASYGYLYSLHPII